MSASRVVVLKFGGSVLRDEGELPEVVHEIYRQLRRGRRVVAVVSALQGVTDALLDRARVARGPAPRARAVGEDVAAGAHAAPADPHGLAALLATGEEQSVHLLTLALGRAGLPARAITTRELALVTEGRADDAAPIAFDRGGLLRALADCPVAVVPGFVGADRAGRPTVLGRGGSDLTALFLAAELAAERCVLLKDVDGLYERDPALPGPPPRRFAALSYEHALELDDRIVQHKAVRFARAHEVAFEVAACGAPASTRVARGGGRELAPPAPLVAPLRVALLGCGAVGRGVLDELLEQPERFTVAGVLVRDAERHERTGVPRSLLCTSPAAILQLDCDVVIELLGGRSPAGALVEAALDRGRDVVTANKELLAGRGAELGRLAAARGASLLGSASVGGALPALELVSETARRHGLRGLEGILNGTCHFVLERIETAGVSLAEALVDARARGFAEADATRDVDGSDAADKLVLLARAAFGEDAALHWARREGIAGVRGATKERLVARAVRTPQGVELSLGLEALADAHPLAACRGAGNALRLLPDGRESEVWFADGAGRWPTTEAVLADLLHLRRRRAQRVPSALAASPAALLAS